MNPRRKNTENFGKMSNADIIIGTYEASRYFATEWSC